MCERAYVVYCIEHVNSRRRERKKKRHKWLNNVTRLRTNGCVRLNIIRASNEEKPFEECSPNAAVLLLLAFFPVFIRKLTFPPRILKMDIEKCMSATP